MKNKKILCTVCARGGSKGLKNKNIKELAGKPLIAYTILQAKQSGLFDHIVISSDSDDIINTAKTYGAEAFFKRDDNLSSDNAGKLDAIKDALNRSEQYYDTQFDIVIDLDATSPLRDIEDIKNALNQFILNDNSNLITAMPARRSPYFNLIEKTPAGKIILSKKLNDTNILRRQDSPECFDMNASIYIWKRDILLNNNSLFLENTGLYIMPEDRSIDIDTELDFKIVECILRNN